MLALPVHPDAVPGEEWAARTLFSTSPPTLNWNHDAVRNGCLRAELPNTAGHTDDVPDPQDPGDVPAPPDWSERSAPRTPPCSTLRIPDLIETTTTPILPNDRFESVTVTYDTDA